MKKLFLSVLFISALCCNGFAKTTQDPQPDNNYFVSRNLHSEGLNDTGLLFIIMAGASLGAYLLGDTETKNPAAQQ